MRQFHSIVFDFHYLTSFAYKFKTVNNFVEKQIQAKIGKFTLLCTSSSFTFKVTCHGTIMQKITIVFLEFIHLSFFYKSTPISAMWHNYERRYKMPPTCERDLYFQGHASRSKYSNIIFRFLDFKNVFKQQHIIVFDDIWFCNFQLLSPKKGVIFYPGHFELIFNSYMRRFPAETCRIFQRMENQTKLYTCPP